MSGTKNKLVIIDGNAIIHRAYHALPPLTTKDGTQVNAAYGFASILLRVMQDLKPTHMAVTFDLAGPTFRDELYTEYKATRVKADQELYDQIPLVHDVVAAFDIPIFEVPGFEADDVIGTISDKTKNAENIIVTGDMDAAQLVNENTKLYALRKGITDTVLYDREKIVERYGLTPEQIVDFKALKGDASDNIPGVAGIGEKTATDLLKQFKTLDGVLLAAENGTGTMSPSVRKKLIDGKKDAALSQELARIRTNVPLSFSLSDATLHNIDWQKVIGLFNKFEFTSLLKRLPTQKFNTAASNEKTKRRGAEQPKIVVVKTKKNIDDTLRRAHAELAIGMQVIPGEGDRITAPPAAILIAIKNEGLIIPWDQCDEAERMAIQDLLQTDTIVGHDLKQLYLRLGDVRGAHLFDLMVASYLLNPGTRAHDIETMLLKSVGVQVDTGKREGLFGMDYEQAARELVLLFSLYLEFDSQLKEARLATLFQDIEMPLIPVLARMEKNGVHIDEKTLAAISKKVDARVEKLTKEIYKESGTEFNIASSAQLRDILYTTLKLPVFGVKKGKTGLSTAAAELEKMRDLHPIVPMIEEYRELTKLQSTYLDALPLLINKKTGRVHTTFNQTVAATGRLSSSDPNLQNIPIRTDVGREIRDAFVAEKGNVLVTLDYSQIELRVAAHLAHDEKMIAAFKAGQDIHAATAAAMHNVKLADVTKEMRRSAKAINFGILYGMQAFGLAARADIPHHEAQQFINKYFETFSGIKKYIADTIVLAKKQGYVETMFGRRRYIPELKASNPQLRNAGERMAVNHPVQGTAADIIKKAMIVVDEKIRRSWDKDVKMILQVHDELVFEVAKNRAKEVAPIIQELMQSVAPLDVPIEVNAGIGENWGVAK